VAGEVEDSPGLFHARPDSQAPELGFEGLVIGAGHSPDPEAQPLQGRSDLLGVARDVGQVRPGKVTESPITTAHEPWYRATSWFGGRRHLDAVHLLWVGVARRTGRTLQPAQSGTAASTAVGSSTTNGRRRLDSRGALSCPGRGARVSRALLGSPMAVIIGLRARSHR
jgi:hypothetical protein